MTKSDLIQILTECLTGDKEETHNRADKALLAYIADQEVTALYDSIPKWYA